MKIIGLFEAKTRFSALVTAASLGQTTIITKNGTPVAEIGPVRASPDRARTAALRLRGIRNQLKGEGKLARLKIRELIDNRKLS